MQKMTRFSLLIALVCTATSFISSAEAPKDKQLAIAQGAALLVRDHGKDPLLWKEASAFRTCIPRQPEAEEGCRWSVYFVTETYLQICADGTSIEGLSGEGIHIYEGETNKFFKWVRKPICEAAAG